MRMVIIFLKSVMQSVSLFDILEFYSFEGAGIEIVSDKEGIPLDEKKSYMEKH